MLHRSCLYLSLLLPSLTFTCDNTKKLEKANPEYVLHLLLEPYNHALFLGFQDPFATAQILVILKRIDKHRLSKANQFIASNTAILIQGYYHANFNTNRVAELLGLDEFIKNGELARYHISNYIPDDKVSPLSNLMATSPLVTYYTWYNNQKLDADSLSRHAIKHKNWHALLFLADQNCFDLRSKACRWTTLDDLCEACKNEPTNQIIQKCMKAYIAQNAKMRECTSLTSTNDPIIFEYCNNKENCTQEEHPFFKEFELSKLVALYKQNPVSPHMKTKHNETALHHFIGKLSGESQESDVAFVTDLIKQDIFNVNFQDMHGRTPLFHTFIAAELNGAPTAALVQALFDYKAFWFTKNQNIGTAFERMFFLLSGELTEIRTRYPDEKKAKAEGYHAKLEATFCESIIPRMKYWDQETVNSLYHFTFGDYKNNQYNDLIIAPVMLAMITHGIHPSIKQIKLDKNAKRYPQFVPLFASVIPGKFNLLQDIIKDQSNDAVEVLLWLQSNSIKFAKHQYEINHAWKTVAEEKINPEIAKIIPYREISKENLITQSSKLLARYYVANFLEKLKGNAENLQ